MSLEWQRSLVSCLTALWLAGCAPGAESAGRGTVSRAPFGVTPGGDSVDIFTLTNPNGVEVRAITYGGIIVSLKVPDRDGQLGDVVLGFDDLDGYLENSPYFGAIIGRYANRIAYGLFRLDDVVYRLATNSGPHHLNGGLRGFDKVVWSGEPFESDSGVGVILTHTSPDGDEGYPGTLDVRATYTLTPRNELVVAFHATTDRATPVNLSHHTYFNLAGDARRDVLAHALMINARQFTPVSATLIPTGAIPMVEDTPFDFTKPARMGARIGWDREQLRHAGGYDHNYVLLRAGPGLVHAAQVMEATSRRVLDVYTTEPGLHFYSGNQLDGSITGKGGQVYGHRSGFSLQTQHYPDSPNKPAFPSTILRPGEEYRARTVFAFSYIP